MSSARSSVVTAIFRLRSTFTVRMSRLLVSNSSHAPRFGISFAVQSVRPVAGSVFAPKYTPGERTNCDTTTRSAPLMMNVPVSVMCGRSPK